MTCRHVKMPGGGTAIVCTRGERKRVCVGCGKPATLLCDFHLGGKTCDKPFCESCGKNIAEDVDYCPVHKDAKITGDLF